VGSLSSYLDSGAGGLQPVGTLRPMVYIGEAPNSFVDKQGVWIKTGQVLTQTTYPELFEQVGHLRAQSSVNEQYYNGNLISDLRYDTQNGLYVGCTYTSPSGFGSAVTSTDLVTFSTTTLTTNLLYSVAIKESATEGEERYLIAGGGGSVFSSTNGTTWNQRVSNTSSVLYVASYVASQGFYFIAGTSFNASSTDGITWDARTNITTGSIYTFAEWTSLNLYVVGLLTTNIYTSTNMITWTSRTSFATGSTRCFYVDGGVLLAGDAAGGYIRATSSTVWTRKQLPTNTVITGIKQINSEYVVTGWNAFGAVAPDGTFNNMKLFYSGVTNELDGPLFANNKYYLSSNEGLFTTTDLFTLKTSRFYDFATEFYIPTVTFTGGTITSNVGFNSASGIEVYIKAAHK
jgi:hypothetical protein